VCTVSRSSSTEIPDTGLQNTLLENFTPSQADEIIAAAGTSEYKQKLADITKIVVEEQGAFGCPWYWVTNKEGKGEPFFGSDRYTSLLTHWRSLH
jgi:2-hydroxychromene-2-carboxylate isomerase